jgi:mRNA interferase MazF
MRRGTIVLTKFPFTDLSSAKRRPGLIISGRINDTNDVIIAFISSIVPVSSEATNYPISSEHRDFLTTGLKKASVVKLDKIATINVSIVSGEIGSISDKTMREIDKCLKIALGLE